MKRVRLSSKGGQLSLRPKKVVPTPAVKKGSSPTPKTAGNYKKAALDIVDDFSNSGFGTGLLAPGPSIVTMGKKR
jgi:hypothetical protein